MSDGSCNYIRDFLTERTVELHAGDLQLMEKKIGSTGTGKESVVSPLLFNRVMVGVAEALAETNVRHTINADNITIWVPGGSDADIETQLQAAVTAIGQHIKGMRLVCSPSRSELLVISPRRKGNIPQRYCDRIKIITASGQQIPEVARILVLGMLISRKSCNGETLGKLRGTAAESTRLIHRVSTRRAGRKEYSLVRLVQSLVISHITYMAAYYNWRVTERNKINTLIRKS